MQYETWETQQAKVRDLEYRVLQLELALYGISFDLCRLAEDGAGVSSDEISAILQKHIDYIR